MTPGISGSELSVKNSLEKIIGNIDGRIFLSTFASMLPGFVLLQRLLQNMIDMSSYREEVCIEL